ncbi:MAG: Do family serine endopeptidase [Pseudomonadota bacterium]
MKSVRSGILLASVASLALGAAAVNAQAPRLMAPPVSAEGTLSFADLVERVSPAVVSVQVEREVEARPLPRQFEEFFNFRFGPPEGRENPFEDDGTRRTQAEGSGFFIDDDGHIVTNNHVVADADKVSVTLADGEELEAEIVGVDPLTDLAVLKVSADNDQPYVEFAEGVSLRVGDWVLAVGNPFGLGGTVTSGIVSAIGGQNREGQYLDFIQIDAPINRGNSGGPTFDLKGRVVGVNSMIFSPNGGSVGIGFAIPAKVARETVAQIIENGSVTRGWLGIQLQELTTELAAALELKSSNGVLVGDVLDGTPAAKAGLEEGDLIISINNDPVSTSSGLSRLVAGYPPGEKVKVKVIREGKEKTVNVTLGQRDNDRLAANDDEPANEDDTLASEVGVRVAALNEALRQQYRVPDGVNGVVVTGVRPGSPAEEAGLAPGVVILQVEGEAISAESQLEAKIEAAKQAGKEAVLMRLQFGPNRQFAALPLDD